MTRIKININSFFKQLDPWIYKHRDDWPQVIELDGILIEDHVTSERKFEIVLKYPEFNKLFTYGELKFLEEFYISKDSYVQKTRFYDFCNSPRGGDIAAVVATRLSGIKRKLRQHGVLDIESQRSGWGEGLGRYRLVKKVLT